MRYDNITAIKNPLKQSWTYIGALCRAQTYNINEMLKYQRSKVIRSVQDNIVTHEHTLSRIKVSTKLFDSRKGFLTISAVSSKYISSKMLELYLGVAGSKLPWNK